jgi:hypothetical protein
MKRIALSGLAAGLVGFIVGSIFYMNPLVMDIYSQHADWPGAKSPECFGGMGPWLLLMLIGALVGTMLIAVLYSYTEKGIKLKPEWKKGALFGFLIWLAFSLPVLYATWLMYAVPEVLLVMNIFGDLFSSLATGITLAVVYRKVK